MQERTQKQVVAQTVSDSEWSVPAQIEYDLIAETSQPAGGQWPQLCGAIVLPFGSRSKHRRQKQKAQPPNKRFKRTRTSGGFSACDAEPKMNVCRASRRLSGPLNLVVGRPEPERFMTTQTLLQISGVITGLGIAIALSNIWPLFRQTTRRRGLTYFSLGLLVAGVGTVVFLTRPPSYSFEMNFGTFRGNYSDAEGECLILKNADKRDALIREIRVNGEHTFSHVIESVYTVHPAEYPIRLKSCQQIRFYIRGQLAKPGSGLLGPLYMTEEQRAAAKRPEIQPYERKITLVEIVTDVGQQQFAP